jgi:hypothetical protein
MDDGRRHFAKLPGDVMRILTGDALLGPTWSGVLRVVLKPGVGREAAQDAPARVRTPVPRMSLRKLCARPELLQWAARQCDALREFGGKPRRDCMIFAAEQGCLSTLVWGSVEGWPLDQWTAAAAAAANHVECLRYLILGVGVPNSVRVNQAAAANGSLEALAWLWENGAPTSDSDIERYVDAAAHSGHTDALQWLRDHTSANLWHRSGCIVSRCEISAVCAGRVHVLEWIQTNTNGFSFSSCTFRLGVVNNQLEVLQWLWARQCPRDESVCEQAALGGHLEVLKWLRSIGCSWDVLTTRAAARQGHLEMLQWLRRPVDPCPWNEWACASAAYLGNLGVLQWLRANGCPWDTETCQAAARQGHLEMLQWLRRPEDPCPWDAMTCAAAAGRGDLELLQRLRRPEDPCPWNEWACASAAYSGRLEVLQWLRAEGCPWDKDTTYVAARCGNLQMLQWAKQNGCPVADDH